MSKLEVLKGFLEELKNDKSVIFNFEKVSNFERMLFLSIQGVLNEKYNYNLDGLTNIHLMKFKANLQRRDIHLDKDINDVVTYAFGLYEVLMKRNLSLGYGASELEEVTENENLGQFKETLERYIKVYNGIHENKS
ncbi:hypothetical protein [Bacillus mycoides]|uniref:Uncharacterized protein n=1 Tax=Bacillus mycoides TaxID=1405 RepID=A0A4U3A3S3_BACMY|nr:hypothetical protein [Bacillus mycoides]TKI82197.1 hypothetical protein FC701_22330 [Bacillus mycoides]